MVFAGFKCDGLSSFASDYVFLLVGTRPKWLVDIHALVNKTEYVIYIYIYVYSLYCGYMREEWLNHGEIQSQGTLNGFQ